MPPTQVTAHTIPSPTSSFTAFSRGPSTSTSALVFIGGLTSGPFTSETLLGPLIDGITNAGLEYSLWEFRMRSSYSGFGFSSLENDVEDMQALVRFLRGLGMRRVVLMGSSTGCQDIITYARTTSDPDLSVDAYILQAPTSDRETGALLMPPEYFAQTLKHAEELIAAGKKEEFMPRELIPPIFNSPVTAYRWHSLIAEGGDDDIFSSDLHDAKLAATFGKVDRPILITLSENDEMVPPTVYKQALLERWIEACPEGFVSGLSALNPGADHELSEEAAKKWFVERVVIFLGDIRREE